MTREEFSFRATGPTVRVEGPTVALGRRNAISAPGENLDAGKEHKNIGIGMPHGANAH
jgi:hypothetical protein